MDIIDLIKATFPDITTLPVAAPEEKLSIDKVDDPSVIPPAEADSSSAQPSETSEA